MMLMALLLAMMSDLSDAELVRNFKEGDRSAYAEIVRRYQNRVYSLCHRWLSNDQVAEEVAQDVFVALFKSLHGFRGDAQLSTWIYRIVINHCKNRRLYRMRRKVDRHDPIDGDPRDEDPRAVQLASTGPGTDAGLHRQEAGRLLSAGLAELDEEQRHIILLRDIEDLSYEEIGEILGLPRGTVKSRLHRARAQLAKLLSRRIRKEDIV